MEEETGEEPEDVIFLFHRLTLQDRCARNLDTTGNLGWIFVPFSPADLLTCHHSGHWEDPDGSQQQDSYTDEKADRGLALDLIVRLAALHHLPLLYCHQKTVTDAWCRDRSPVPTEGPTWD